MGISLGIVGLPNVGKSTLFNALTSGHAAVSNYPFCTIDPNVAVVNVPDPRLEDYRAFMHSPKSIPATIEFWDIAGLAKNAHKGEGLGNQFLSHIRKVDAILHVVRCFSDPNIVHVDGRVDPVRDIEAINVELILADLAGVEKKLQGAKSSVKTGEKKKVMEHDFYEKMKNHLGAGHPARTLALEYPEEEVFLRDLTLLTVKPVLYVANTAEIPEEQYVSAVKEAAQKEGAGLIVIPARLDVDLKELSPEEQVEYLKALEGEAFAGLPELIQASYKLLGLITFFTANEKEAHAWAIKQGTAAKEAAGKVHTDFEKGFISAEALRHADLPKCKNHAEARDKGILHLEGKGSQVVDGDLVYFHFNL
ncbi:MAG: redox-regulated ATPase YchF [Candidatus Saganbacteria bacterium]|nr:redox-regulated ATPase YchF [Candidatus Saganbacteria bacterium]